MRGKFSKAIALSGILAALAIVVMCLGGLVPVATYVCPVVCALICLFVLQFCGKRIAWTWYVAVSLLSLLIGPDKEVAFVFLLLGYYPIIKPFFDRGPFGTFLKVIYFNFSIALVYLLMYLILGLENDLFVLSGIGVLSACVLLILGNITFFFLDTLLHRLTRKM